MLAAFFAAYWGVVLRIDAQADVAQQLAIGGCTWIFLGVALKVSSPEQRAQTLTMVAVATCVEVVGSILWGVYRYRLGNLPSYVPPGHGLFYLMALRLSLLPAGRWLRRATTAGVALAATALVARNVLAPAPDVVGLLTWTLFAAFLVRSPARYLYALSFTLTMTLEFYGTGLGTWSWLPLVPYLGIPAANPPAAIGVGYCVMDAAARYVAPRARGILARIDVPLAHPRRVLLPIHASEPL